MNSEQIQSFLTKKVSAKSPYVKINFQKRASIYGLFLLEEKDFYDLSKKNFWRIVPQKNFDEYNKSKNAALASIFNGSEMTGLSVLEDKF